MAGERGNDRQPSRPYQLGDRPARPRTGAAAQPTVPVTEQPVTGQAAALPGWVVLVRAPNPGPMTLEGTNTWVLRPAGERTGAVVVDPGPDDLAHLRAVVEAAGPVAAVLVTHGHPDHVAGLDRFRELTGAPVITAADQRSPMPAVGLSVTTLPTPGHTHDSVCYVVEAEGQRAVLTGDTILGRGTTVVAWPDGDLGDYLRSLTRLTGLAGVPVLPGHGPALADCAAAATSYLAHRQQRLAQVREAVTAGVTTPAEVVAQVYPDLDDRVREAAERTVRAQLAYLQHAEWESRPAPPPLDSP